MFRNVVMDLSFLPVVMTGSCVILWPGILSAAEQKTAERIMTLGGDIQPVYFLKMGLSLALVMMTFVAFVWLFRRVGGFSPARNNVLSIVGGLSLGARDRLVLIKVADRHLLLGVSPGQIRKLYELDNLPEEVTSYQVKSGVSDVPFSKRLKSALNVQKER